jgi:hypothetical protein
MSLRLLAKDDFTLTLANGDQVAVAKNERITDAKLINRALTTHPDFILREEVPSVELDEPVSTIPPKVPQRAPKPEKS